MAESKIRIPKLTMSFRRRQFLTLLALAIVPLLLTLGTALPNIQNFVIQRSVTQLETVADLKTVQVRQWLDRGREVATLVANRTAHEMQAHFYEQENPSETDDLRLYEDDLSPALAETASVFPEVQSISLLHPSEGRVLLSTDPLLVGRERQNEDYFTAGQRGLFVSPVAYSVGREAPVLTVAAPAHNDTGELLAVVAVEMNLTDLEATLASRAGLGQTGRAYLVEAFGFYVTLPPDSQNQPLSTIADSTGVRRALTGDNGSDSYLDPDGVRVLGVYRWLPDANMGLLVEIDKAELTNQYKRIWILVVVAEVFLLALAIFAARTLTDRLVSPLEQIANVARALKDGDLSRRTMLRGTDEIGQLATAFDEMADSLQASHQDLEETIQQRSAALEESRVKSSELETFSYSVAHDLRSPLRAVAGFSHILIEEHAAELSDDAQRYLHLVEKNTLQMSRLIDALLSFSQLGLRSLTKQSTNPGKLVSQILDGIQQNEDERQVKFTIGELPVCHADPDLLKQVFANLIDNALKFTRQQTNPVIEIDSQQQNGETVYVVKDNGVGFDMQYYGKLFGMFQRLHRYEDYEGTGVGLATVEHIIQRHGGRIWAEAKLDEGATFYFTLE